MKKTTFAIGCIILLFVCPEAFGAQGFYVSGNLGYAILNDADFHYSYDDDLTSTLESDAEEAFAVAFGYDFGNKIRVEDEIAYQKNDKGLERYYRNGEKFFERDEVGETYSISTLLNGYYDFVNQSAFTPYISAGIGLSRITEKIPGYDFDPITQTLIKVDYDDDDWVFAYQVGVGVGYSILPRLTIDIKYRFFGANDPKFFDGESMEYSSHNFYTGLRFSF